MKNKKLYFENIDSEICRPLDWYVYDAKLEGLKEIKLVEAVRDRETKDYVWCSELESLEMRSLCRKSECSLYTPNKSGRGVCVNRGKLYLHGQEVIIDVETLQKKVY